MMDRNTSTFSDKTNNSKPRTNPRLNDASKICRQKRVFGAARSTNILTRPLTERFIDKPKHVATKKQPKTTPASVVDTAKDLQTEASGIEFQENVNIVPNKKDEAILDQQTKKTSMKSKEKNSEEPQTPVVSHLTTTTKSKLSATPFFSALRCSKCRFDRLETSSYWIAQIKLAESVGKHFVAVDFFRLAIESQAEPIRNLRIELKRYVSRHGSLSQQREWKEVGAMYGLRKPESNTCEVDSNTQNDKSIS
ncbi:hypothetical protein QN277_003022 [Acacia crassicarpa]|uniref:Uncharacterized protein n=1 Tax=Acacia crassicarpa TaxID=499986 RepID=A0AAE1NC70_9FABA|nr:hypothetical protein QN277_003022 [Acacia crassicarpa]